MTNSETWHKLSTAPTQVKKELKVNINCANKNKFMKYHVLARYEVRKN